MTKKIMRFTWCTFPCCLFILHLTSNWAFAQQFTGPVAMGLGNAGVASAESAESTFLNPASLPHAQSFSAGLFYRDGWLDGTNHITDIGVNLVDNTEGVMVPGSIGFIQKRTTFSGMGAADEKLWHVSIGNFVAHQISMGLSLYYSDLEQEGERFETINGNFGTMWNPDPNWALGLTFFNLKAPDNDTPERFQQQPKVLLGLNVIATQFVRIRFDTGKQLRTNSDNRWEYKGGFETSLGEFIVLRFGWESDQLARQELFTAGLSFIGPKFNLNYAYQKSQEEDELGALHSVDLNVPF